MQAMPSLLPMKPRWSVVVAFTDTLPASTPSSSGDPIAHGIAVGPDSRALRNDRHVGVHKSHARRRDDVHRLSDEPRAVGVGHLGTVDPDERAEVPRAGGTEEGVDQRMEDDIGVAVSSQRQWRVERDTAQPQWTLTRVGRLGSTKAWTSTP